MTNPDNGPYGPDVFMDPDTSVPLSHVNQKLPDGAAEGGPIEAVKRATVTALRDAFKGMDIRAGGKEPYIDLEYPLEETSYPGIWVQFSLNAFVPLGMGHEVVVQTVVDGQPVWTPIAAFYFEGAVTLSLVALTNLDRDQLADGVMAVIVASRTPQVVLTQTDQDTRKNRSLIQSFNANPYVSLTPNFARFKHGGQGVDVGVPWQPDALAYTDSYSFDVVGQTQIQYMHDGTYTLSRVDYTGTTVMEAPADAYPPTPDPLGRGPLLGNRQPWHTL